MSEFQRPPVADWMSPPKSSNLKNVRDFDVDVDDAGSSEAGWSTPPRSRKTNSQCDQHFSLHLSPDVSITLHSPRSVNALVTSTNDVGSKKFSMKLLSPKHRNRMENDEFSVTDIVPDEVHAKTVHKTVLKEFIPPSFITNIKEIKSPRELYVQRIQIPDFKPRYPINLSKKPNQSKKNLEKTEVPAAKKRQTDVKSARDFIQMQQKKRVKIAAAEKSRKKIESEERKKKLEELQVRALQLATTCRKKQAKNSTCPEMKTVDNDDDLTLSLGLRQVRPKRSFKQALASLGKPVVAKLPHKQEEIIEECFKENDVPLDFNVAPVANDIYYEREIRKLSDRLTRPKKDASECLLKLAEALETKCRTRRKMKSIENKPYISDVAPKKIKTVAVDVEAIACLADEIKGIASGFQVLQTAIARDERKRNSDWLFTIEPHPYNVFTAVNNKLQPVEKGEPSCKILKKVSEDLRKVSGTPKSVSGTPKSVSGTPKSVSGSPKSVSGSPKSVSGTPKSVSGTPKSVSGTLKSDSGSSEPSSSILDSEKLIISTDSGEKTISERISQLSSFKPNVVLMPTDVKLNNTVKSDDFGKRSDSISTQVIDNLSGNSEKEEKVSNLMTRPDPFQALLDSEFHILDNLQQNLARFIESKRLKTEMAVNTDRFCNDRSVQTSVVQSDHLEDSIVTEISLSEKSDNIVKKSDSSSTTTGISLKMLTRMIKEEEIRSEHQMALIQLRQHALVEKTKGCLSELEEKKKQIKDNHSDGPISVIKKKQRGVLLRYQSEQKEIVRLKRMHQIASEERRRMIQEQEQIHQMQLSTKNIMLKINQDDANSSASEITEDVHSQVSSSDSINTFIHHSNASENASDDEILVRNQNILRERIKQDDEKLNKCKKFLGEKEQTLMQQKHFVEEILEWERRLDAEETRIKEMKMRALRAAKPSGLFLTDKNESPVKPAESESKNSSSIPEALSTGSGADEIPEEILSKPPTIKSYTSESFESSSDAPKSIAVTSKALPVVKPVLSPRHGPRRRYSSGSDDSANLSHTETTSEPSDVECRLKALEEQLKCRKMEADRLRREHKRKQRERLKEKEESLKKQIKAYDAYINKLKRDVEQETKNASPVIKPVIKQPKAVKIQYDEKSISEEVEEKISWAGNDATIESESQIIETQSLAESSEEIDESVKTSYQLEAEDVPEKSTVTACESFDYEAESYEADSFESDEEAGKPASDPDPQKNVDGIVDELLRDFLTESVDIVGEILNKRKHRTVEAVTDYLAQKILDDALNDILQVYTNKRKRNEGDTEIGIEVTWDVRRRIHEIMGAQMALKNRNCDQTMLQTTYDVSPSNSPTHDEFFGGFFEQQQFISSLSPNHQSKEVHVTHDSDGQEWFDEDFGLTKSRREAEALRLQQLQIEQEIEELQAQQEQVPYFFLREIPNKPPPPYTPPGKPTAANFPTSETEISRQMQLFARNAFKILQGCRDAAVIVKPDLSQHFTRCLWELAQQLVSEICSSGLEDEVEESRPWKRHPLPLAKWRLTQRSLQEDAVVDQVVDRSLMLFGFRPRVEQETLIVRWSRKKRDHVDELLVWDSQAEEAEWTWYDQDVVQVKNDVTDQLMDSLLHETASVFNDILKKRANMS